ncbi:MAG: LPS-assembly protein LptD [Verrucomicrobiia bacterium]
MNRDFLIKRTVSFCFKNAFSYACALFLFSTIFYCSGGEDYSQPKTGEIIIKALDPEGVVDYDINTGEATAEKGVRVFYGDSVITAKRIKIKEEDGKIWAEGDVCVVSRGQIWRAGFVEWDYKEQKIEAKDVRGGAPPFFVKGSSISANLSNNVYHLNDVYITTDDFSKPAHKVRTKYLKIVPEKYLEAHNAYLYAGDVPVMYFPYYRRRLGRHLNYFTHTPGYRGKYGPYLLNSYNWYLREELDGALHLDYRQRRGVGFGSDVNLHLGQYGETAFEYYFVHDEDPSKDVNGSQMPADRHKFNFTYKMGLSTNTIAKIVGRYQSDQMMLHDFFEHEYRRNTQPASFFELNHQWSNFGLDLMAQPRINDFYETVERLPDIKLTGYRQQLGESPFYYESESSGGWFRRKFANNEKPDFAAWRADTFHQILLPQTYYGWLNITPRVGGRFTAYSEATGNGATTKSEARTVFNTGVELSTKASKVWANTKSKMLDLDGLRHIIQPVINYVYVPSPSVKPNKLPQFDYEVYGYRPLPIDYPDYNSIDSVDSQNVFRFSLWNKLQTKRKGEIDNLFDWQIFTDWRLSPRPGQSTFSDVFSQFDFRPRSYLMLSQDARFDINSGYLREINHRLTLTPNNIWSVTIGNRYIRNDPLSSADIAQNIYYTSFYYKFNENWGFHMSHHFEARDGRMEEQYYSLFRDLRSWTAALTLRIRSERSGPDDFTIALVLSLKAFPRYRLERILDERRPYEGLTRIVES